MNAQLLKRLFRAFSEGSDQSVESVCSAIIQDTRKKNHKQLADQLQEILATRTKRPSNVHTLRDMATVPAPLRASRNIEPLVTIVSRESLEHHMVLTSTVEEKFQRIEKEFAARERLANHGLRPRRKILLYGPPGCGKTLGAKRLAWTTGLKFVKIRFDVMISSLFGESASNLRSIFDFCVQNPCLLLLDECDFIARSRVTSRDIGEVQRIVNTLLQLLEDYNFPGMVVATTNIYQELDHALFRRFDDAIEIPLPGENEIARLLKEALVSVKAAESIEWKVLAKELDRLSAADIVKIGENAAKSTVLAGNSIVSQNTLSAVIRDFSRLSD